MTSGLSLSAGFVAMLAANAMFAGAEIGIAPVSRESVEKFVGARVPGARLMRRMLNNRQRFLITLMIGRITSLVIGTLLAAHLIGLATRPWDMGFVESGTLSAAITALLFILAQGPLAKLVSGGEFEDRVSRFVAVLFPAYLLLWPATACVDRLFSMLVRKNLDLAEKEEAFREIVRAQSESGVIEEEEGEMIQGIIELSDTTVREVMVPRIDVIAAEKGITIDGLMELFEKWGHSRIPVYEERIDNVIGVLYAKDLLTHVVSHGKEQFDITAVMREAYFVPEIKKISELLQEIKKNKVHLAVVVDEYGGTAGIVALEDLLEEIVGEIGDEYDVAEERDYTWLDDTSLLIDAGLDIDDVNDIIGTDIPDEYFDTLGGFLYTQLGRIPEGGEKVVWEDITFEVKRVTGNRIEQVLVVLPPKRVDRGRRNGAPEEAAGESAVEE